MVSAPLLSGEYSTENLHVLGGVLMDLWEGCMPSTISNICYVYISFITQGHVFIMKSSKTDENIRDPSDISLQKKLWKTVVSIFWI